LQRINASKESAASTFGIHEDAVLSATPLPFYANKRRHISQSVTMKLILTKARFMTDILDIVRSLRLQIPQNFGILDMLSSLPGRGKKQLS
jgi:hypothetical protein